MNNQIERAIERLQTKAVNSMSGKATSMTTSMPDTVKLTQDPVKLMDYNRGYVYAANNKVAEAVASLPFRMYAYLPKSQADELTTPHRSIEGKARLELTGKLGLNAGEPKTLIEVFEHPFIDLMEHPADDFSRYDWFKVVSSYLGVIGNAYVHIDKTGGTTKLIPLLSEYIVITYDEHGVITKYTYYPQGTMTHREFDPSEILHFRNRTAGSVIAGMGNLEAALASANLSSSTQAYLSALLANKAAPGGLFSLKNFTPGKDLTAYEKFKAKIQEQFGRRNRGKPLVTFGEMTYTPITNTMHETRADFFTAQAKQEIAAVFGVPLTLLDESNSNRATALAAKQSMLQYAVYPRVEMILGTLNRRIVKQYDPRLIFSYDVSEALENDPKEQSEVITKYVDAGIFTVNEARDMLGMATISEPEQ